MGNKGKQHPFSYSSSSSPSSTSSHQYKIQQQQQQQQQAVPPIYEGHHQQVGSWLGNNKYYDPDEDNNASVAVSDDVRHHHGGGGGGGGGGGDSSSDVAAAAALELISASTSTNVEKEHMFDKVVTPSDVGKLNRLVIPKQHAERYFPLDSSANEKGLLLNFEDRNGKLWRFRYSYWNSSQSYVMTKGWSRFVKEKKLDAGDIVSFQRGVGDLGKDRLYIDWRRRPEALTHHDSTMSFQYAAPPHHLSFHRASPVPWSPLLMRPPLPLSQVQLGSANFTNRGSYYTTHASGYNNNYSASSMGSVYYVRSPQQQQLQIGTLEWQQQQQQQQQQQMQQQQPMVFESVPVVQGKAAAKRLRLFGVNMECPISETDECDILSSNAISSHHAHATIHHHELSSEAQAAMTIHHQLSSSSSSSSSSHQSHLQLRLYNGTPLPVASAAALQLQPPRDILNKGKASMSLDLDI